MCSYHGGKQRIGKELASRIVDETMDIVGEGEFEIKGYCEPFCGMLGVYQHIPELFEEEGLKLKYKAGDTNKSVIMMWNEAKKGWKPPMHVTEREFNTLKISKDSALKGYAGHQYSFGGQYFQGYAPKYGKILKNSQTVVDKISNIGSKMDNSNTAFSHGSYTQYSKLKHYIIYCDPPYSNSKKHYTSNEAGDMSQKFDDEKFFNWCRLMAEDNIVFVSSYNAPEDFEEIFSISSKITGITPSLLKKKKTQKNRLRTEKLYILFPP